MRRHPSEYIAVVVVLLLTMGIVAIGVYVRWHTLETLRAVDPAAARRAELCYQLGGQRCAEVATMPTPQPATP